MSLTVLFVRRLARAVWCLAIAAGVPGAASAQTASTRPSPWTAQTISDSTPDGSAERVRFIHQPLAGNVQIIARVDFLALRSHGGLMLRASLQSAAAYASIRLSATGGPDFHHRARTGGPITKGTGELAIAAQ